VAKDYLKILTAQSNITLGFTGEVEARVKAEQREEIFEETGTHHHHNAGSSDAHGSRDIIHLPGSCWRIVLDL
jgi:hypothetical protein